MLYGESQHEGVKDTDAAEKAEYDIGSSKNSVAPRIYR